MAVRVTKDDFEQKVLNSSLPVVVDFYSDSCVACKRLAPVLGDLEDNYEGRLAVVKVNTNFDPELSESFEVRSNPTILLFRAGKEVERRVGAASYKALEEWIAPYVYGLTNKKDEEVQMIITVAGDKKEYQEGLTLSELIEAEKVEMPEYVTVSINDEFIPGEEKDSTVLKEGDSVEFLYFMGGGC